MKLVKKLASYYIHHNLPHALEMGLVGQLKHLGEPWVELREQVWVTTGGQAFDWDFSVMGGQLPGTGARTALFTGLREDG